MLENIQILHSSSSVVALWLWRLVITIQSSNSFHVLSTATLSLCTSLLICCRRSQKLIWHTSQYPSFWPLPWVITRSLSLVCAVVALVSPHALTFVFADSVCFCWLLKRNVFAITTYTTGRTTDYTLTSLIVMSSTYIEFVLEFWRLTLVVSRNTLLNPDFCLLAGAFGVTVVMLCWIKLLHAAPVILLWWGAE